MTALDLTKQMLQEKNTFFQELLEGNFSKQKTLQLLLTALFCFALFGVIIGGSHSPLQSISSAVKLPVLFLLTGLICFPTLYFFLAVFGTKLSAGQLAGFGIGTLAFMGMALLAFAPLSLFFLITTHNYVLFKLINVLVFAIAGFSGIYLYLQHLRGILDRMQDPSSRRKASIFLLLWLGQFALIGAQLSYALSPFFGYPDESFQLLTSGESDFFTDILETLWRLI